MESHLRSLAASPWKLTASALESPDLNNEDLERLLQFLSEVNDVLFKAFHPLKVCLQRLVDMPLSGNASDRESISGIADELTAIQRREYYHVPRSAGMQIGFMACGITPASISNRLLPNFLMPGSGGPCFLGWTNVKAMWSTL
jgi:hypothetical protein